MDNFNKGWEAGKNWANQNIKISGKEAIDKIMSVSNMGKGYDSGFAEGIKSSILNRITPR